MEFKMTLFGSLLLVSLCLPATIGDYQVAPVYSYAPAPVYYEKPVYNEPIETSVDYREANNTRDCGVQPTVHRHGLPKDETTFGEYPWVVAILDTYQVYKCSGVLITPRHVLTAGNCVTGVNANDIVVRVGDYDLQTDHNYLEVYKNYEIPVCKKHFYYSVPQYGYDQSSQYGYSSPKQQPYYQSDSVYDAVILELSDDVDLDVYPQVEPICLPEFYYRSKEYYKEYYTGYGQSVGSSGNDKQVVNREGSSEDLECWVVGYSNSPSEEIKYQTEKTSYTAQSYSVPSPPPPPSYGYGYAPPPYNPPQTYTKYVPAYSYESYSEYSLTPRRAKVHKVYEEYYQPPPPAYQPPAYGYGSKAPAPAPAKVPSLTESWEADYSFDTCRADIGSAVMCKVGRKLEEEDAGKAYNSYVPEYYNPPPPPPAYNPPAPTYYSPPPPPQYYSPPPPPQYYSAPPVYAPPPYQPPRYTREIAYSPPSAYSTPQQYAPAPAPYAPPPAPASNQNPIKAAEDYNDESRRFVVYGIVQYPTECSKDSYESKKLKVTPIKDILPWVLNVIHTPVSQCSVEAAPVYEAPAPAYQPPTYDYQPPAYQPPTYDYQPPVYQAPTMDYQPPVYQPPTYDYQPPVYQPPTYDSPAYAPPVYSPPAYVPPPTYNQAPYVPPTYY